LNLLWIAFECDRPSNNEHWRPIPVNSARKKGINAKTLRKIDEGIFKE
jgi:hypothetical protein